MKRLFPILLCAMLAVLPGCSALLSLGSSPIEKQKKVTTSTDLDGNKTVTEEESLPPAISDEIAKMQKACFESFDKDSSISDTVASRMESRDLKDVLVFKEFRLGLREARGFDPREVCKSPTSIYDYAIHHDTELYKTIRHGMSEVAGTAKALGPWAALYGVAKGGQETAGNRINTETANIDNSFNRTSSSAMANRGPATSSTSGTAPPAEPVIVEPSYPPVQ